MKYLQETHDLSLPKWGPYSKKYIGISHIPDEKAGLRFDLSVFPGFYRGRVEVPSVTWESGYHPWEASPDLCYYSNRHELEWKDRVYTDISFSKLSDNARLIRCECVNQTSFRLNMVLHYMAYMNFPPLKICSTENIYPCTAELPSDAVWIDSMEYSDLVFAIPRPKDNLVPDGLFRGEIRGNGFVKGSGVGNGFGKDAGDTVIYKFSLQNTIRDGIILFRYHLPSSQKSCFLAEGIINTYVEFAGDTGFNTVYLPAGNLQKGNYYLKMTSLGECTAEIDGFCLLEASKIRDVKFIPVEWNPYPEISPGPVSNSIILKYKDVGTCYGLVWLSDSFEVREFYCDELDRFMRHTVHNHVLKAFKGKGDGHFTNVFLRPIELDANSRKVKYGMVCSGSRVEVENQIFRFIKNPEKIEEVYISQKLKAITLPAIKEGEKYLFSQQMMAANTLSGIVYPIYARGTYIKHYSPGRWWDCLYTWDSGFLGIGLSELSIDSAVECLNAYLTEPGDTHAAFIHHGSPVPVQIYLFFELWNRTQSVDFLKHFYPRLRQYYNFLSGKAGSSTTRQLKSDLIKTWDYFYNSGGWDDYPPQVYVHEKGLEKSVCPVVNTAHGIRTAKILKMAADVLGMDEDVKDYENDIRIFTQALQEYSWDENSGYYGYVCHDENGFPIGILRHKSGVNFNMGLDGTYPLVAGICTDSQKSVLIGRLMQNDRMWTEIGLSTVDRSAPYYRIDGYWNGAVWMPHQWFYWKTMLDLGRPDLAFKIANTGLELWKSEVDETYNCYEHFIIQSGRGAGWHQFSGISTPVMNWFGAYYTQGRLTCGFDIWVEEKNFYEDNTLLQARLKTINPEADNISCIIVTMNPKFRYKVFWNGEEISCNVLFGGTLEICITWTVPQDTLDVVRIA